MAPLLAEAIDVPEAWNDVFNIGADDPHTLNDLAARVAHAMGVTPRIRHLPPRLEVQHAWCGHEKFRRVFGMRETTTLDDGLARMAAWVKTHRARQPSVRRPRGHEEPAGRVVGAVTVRIRMRAIGMAVRASRRPPPEPGAASLPVLGRKD